MTTIHTLGYPRIGAQRKLKFALESFWKGAYPKTTCVPPAAPCASATGLPSARPASTS